MDNEVRMKLSEKDFEDIVTTMMPSILKYCYGIMINYYDAEDVALQAFVKTYAVLDRFENVMAVKSYIYKAAYTGCIDELRSKKRYKVLIDKYESSIKENVADNGTYINETTDNNYISDELAAALETLTPMERALVYGSAVEEKSYKELAEVFDKKEATLRKKYERARKKLKTYLTGKEME